MTDDLSSMTISQRVKYYKVVSEQAAFHELGRRIGYLISTSKLEEAAITAQFQKLLLLVMEQHGLDMDDAIDRLWTEHKKLMDKLPIPIPIVNFDTHDVLARGNLLMEELNVKKLPQRVYVKKPRRKIKIGI